MGEFIMSHLAAGLKVIIVVACLLQTQLSLVISTLLDPTRIFTVTCRYVVIVKAW